MTNDPSSPRAALLAAAERFGTPLYVYDLDAVRVRLARLRDAFGSQFGVSFAVKSNPNVALLRGLAPLVDSFDVSAFAEAERAIAAGAEPARLTFCGPGKRPEEIRRAIRLGIGELVIESLHEAGLANRFAGEMGARQTVLLRFNPATSPRAFGVNMSGKPSQFGIDEEDMDAAIGEVAALPHLDLAGFHVYSGSNSLSVEALAENFGIVSAIFRRAAAIGARAPRKLVFGAGFGVPYLPGDEEIDIAALADLVLPQVAALRRESAFADTRMELELGRWLVGPCGWLLSSIIGAKASRGTDIRICDAGFNTHLAAYGMMGSVIRRNWRIANLSNPGGETGRYTVVGPLCTTIDTLATKLELPVLAIGDVIAIENSGAYGLSASPTRFISHPEPREALLEGGELRDVSESLLNHWRLADN
jgi:diaminopimelate decarboxylase